jgi:lysophospholipase L1-like esterase
MQPLRVRIGLLAISTLLCLAVAELGLRAFTPYPIHGGHANRVPHDNLGYVLDPEFDESDNGGFRNPDGLGNVDLVTLGDSHTYGFNVGREDSWPSVLAEAEGLSVYNYGMGGYGTLQHWWLFSRALERNPQEVVVGLYLANDLADTCALGRSPYWRTELDRMGLETADCATDQRDTNREVKTATPLWQRTALGSAYEQLVDRRLAIRRHPERFVWFEDAGRKTPLAKRRVSRHRRATNLSDPGIAEAYTTTRHLIAQMAAIAKEQGIRFGVLLIPSKENALFESANAADPFHAELANSVRQERALTRELVQFLRDRSIPASDALAALQQASATPLYPNSESGHPLAAGYQRYAEAARELLRD